MEIFMSFSPSSGFMYLPSVAPGRDGLLKDSGVSSSVRGYYGLKEDQIDTLSAKTCSNKKGRQSN